MTVYPGDEPYQVPGLMATAEFLRALRMRPFLGRGFEPSDSRAGAGQVAILGYQLWETRFGRDSSVVGRSIRLASGDCLVVGIAPPGFRFPPNASTGLILSMTLPSQTPAARKSGWTFALGRVRPGTSLEAVGRELGTISGQLGAEFPETNQASSYFAVPLRDAVVGSTKTALILLLGAVGLVLLIACANVANLLLVRSLTRGREMAVRAALGAGRSRLTTQLLMESLVLAVLAGALGVGVAHLGVSVLVELLPLSVSTDEVGLNGSVLGFAVLLTFATAFGAGAISALTHRTESMAVALVGSGRASTTAEAGRTSLGLVAAEIGLAAMLLVGAGLIFRSFARLLSVDPGFRVEGVLTVSISIPDERYADSTARALFHRRAFEAIDGLAEVEAVGAAVVVPLTGNNWTVPLERADRPVAPGERPPEVGWQVASRGYFGALGIPLLAGRLFAETDRPGGPPVAIVSRSTERRFFDGESAVGKRIRLGSNTAEVVGVVGDVRRAGLSDEPRADLYFPLELFPGTAVNLFIRTASEPTHRIESVKAAVREIEPETVFQGTLTLADIAGQSVRLTRMLLWLLGAFAAVALVLAVVGIYGVMSYVVRQRTREIGTRIALGAGKRAILWMVMRQGAIVAGIGIAVGLGAGLGAAWVLRSALYAVSPADPAVLAGASLVLAAATMLACYFPARRAASIDPARTLADPLAGPGPAVRLSGRVEQERS